MSTNEVHRAPFRAISVEKSAFKDTYGGAENIVALNGMQIRPDESSDTAIISMHPIGGTGGLPIMGEFARQGIHVLACDSRYRGADYALIMEKVAIDLGVMVKHAKHKLGYKKVVILGWSGGGSLSAFYQAQAENPTVEDSPGGGGPDLTKAELEPGDAVIMMAAHVSRHQTLTEWMDASIIDETNPEKKDPTLDIYGGKVSPPFDEGFVRRIREAQIARNRKITAWVKEKLQYLRDNNRPNEEYAFVTHGTMADPRWVDPAIDPNDRKPGWCYLGDPKIVNMGPVGLARFSTLRSWLSQWSFDDANAEGPKSLATVERPVLVINNTADDACTPSHAQRLFGAVRHNDKAYFDIQGATHYYQGQKELAAEAVSVVKTWLNDIGVNA